MFLTKITHSIILLNMRKKKNETTQKLIQDASLLSSGQIIDGRIIEIGKNMIFVDLGPYKTGVLLGREVKENKEIIKNFKPGDSISAMVIEPENEDGYVELSLKEAYYKKTWEALRELKDGEFPVKVKITQANRGGLIITVKNVVGFLPVSQLSSKHYPYVENGDPGKIASELNKLVNQEIEVKIIDLDQRQQKLIVSEKALESKRKREILEKYKIGDVVQGEISGITNFGAFVKIPITDTTIEGLIHISELDWQLIDDPRQIVKVGEKVKVKIASIEGDRLALSLRAMKKDPWDDIEKKYKKGNTIKGKVARISSFGAFVEVEKNIYGLIHGSEIESLSPHVKASADTKTLTAGSKDKEEKKALKLNKKYDFKITFLDPKTHKMTLSLASPHTQNFGVGVKEK